MAKRDRRLLRFAREMRTDQTKAEDRLWYHLRARQMGAKFRRQEPIGPFIADFASLKAHLIIEVDGDSHESKERDARRDQWFLERGWFVLRFWDEDVLKHTDDVLDVIDLALRHPHQVHDPLNRE